MYFRIAFRHFYLYFCLYFYLYMFQTKVMVIFITLHWHTFISCLLMFISVSDLSFATGVRIPAGTQLVVPVQLVQKDDFSWGNDASDFNPYRFLSNGANGSGMSLESWYFTGRLRTLWVTLSFVIKTFVVLFSGFCLLPYHYCITW